MDMDWSSIITALIGAIAGGGGSFLYFRPKLREAHVNASQAEFEALKTRINDISEMYSAQGKILDGVNKQVMSLQQELQDKNLRILQLEQENRSLTEKVGKLEQELKAYKTIVKQK